MADLLAFCREIQAELDGKLRCTNCEGNPNYIEKIYTRDNDYIEAPCSVCNGSGKAPPQPGIRAMQPPVEEVKE